MEFSRASYKLVRMKPIIYVARHGSTLLNDSGKFRGWTNIPLDKKGVDQAKEVKTDLEDIDLAHAYSSDMRRAKETMDIILEGHDIVGKELRDMRPWDVGKFTGQPKNEENKKELQDYADTTNKVIPGGESLNQFRERYLKAFSTIVDEAQASVFNGGGPSLMAQHASNCHEIGNIIYGDIDTLDVDPGGIIVVSMQGNNLSASIFKGAATGDKPEVVS